MDCHAFGNRAVSVYPYQSVQPFPFEEHVPVTAHAARPPHSPCTDQRIAIAEKSSTVPRTVPMRVVAFATTGNGANLSGLMSAFRVSDNPQVFQGVVRTVAVDVLNGHSFRDRSVCLLPDYAMFIGVRSPDRNLYVSVGSYAADNLSRFGGWQSKRIAVSFPPPPMRGAIPSCYVRASAVRDGATAV